MVKLALAAKDDWPLGGICEDDEFSSDGGKSWQPTTLGEDFGKYSFRQWQTNVTLAQKGYHALMVRCRNLGGSVQPPSSNWNNGGFMRNVIETVQVTAV